MNLAMFPPLFDSPLKFLTILLIALYHYCYLIKSNKNCLLLVEISANLNNQERNKNQKSFSCFVFFFCKSTYITVVMIMNTANRSEKTGKTQ